MKMNLFKNDKLIAKFTKDSAGLFWGLKNFMAYKNKKGISKGYSWICDLGIKTFYNL